MDRISGLPADVIGHIFSFFPTIESLVETSTLSKTWRFRWADLTTIAYYRGTSTDSEFELWISALRNVRFLVIRLDHQLKLPPCLFVSKTLVDLRIFDCGSISTSVAIHFPVLRKLKLNNVVYEDEESLPHLLSRCPVIEELIILRMIFSLQKNNNYNVAYCNVSSLTLTRLVLDLEKVFLNLDTPALGYLRLRLRQSLPNFKDWAPLDSLVEADLDLNEDNFEGGMFSAKPFYAFIVKNFVRNLCNVKCLTLSTRGVPVNGFSQLLVQWRPPFALDVKFNNLTEVKLSADWQFVTSFLVNANNLRVLNICRMVDHKAQHWIEPKPLPNCCGSHIYKTACLKSQLERVSVVDFGWARKQEFDMVSYILKYAKVLKTMEILYTPHYDLDSNQKLEAHNKLASFERGSKKCQLLFV